jgi:hypothetical protein
MHLPYALRLSLNTLRVCLNGMDFKRAKCYQAPRCRLGERSASLFPLGGYGMFSRILLITLVFTASGFAGDTLQSGPQVGQRVPGAFEPWNVTGPDAGKKSCLFCRNGTNPVVMIFARETSPELTALLKRVDDATRAHANDSMGSCAIFCSEDESLPTQLADLAKQSDLNNIILATCAAGGPPRYKIAADAHVTVLVYTHCVVKANHSFKKGELTQAAIDKILADLPLILSQE